MVQTLNLSRYAVSYNGKAATGVADGGRIVWRTAPFVPGRISVARPHTRAFAAPYSSAGRRFQAPIFREIGSALDILRDPVPLKGQLDLHLFEGESRLLGRDGFADAG